MKRSTVMHASLATVVALLASVLLLRAAAPTSAPAGDARAADGSFAYTNRLIHEKSPYLLQHAHNPVDWYPWGDEAFAAAQKQNKPIFLSIGYSTCHWCHVMERESFSDPAIAKQINDHFIPIKVDREERPDVDETYMTFVQATTGSGGWPMTVILTPQRKPFFGGTYFPPHDVDGMTGLTTLLDKVSDAWQKDHERVVASADQIAAALAQRAAARATTSPTDAIGPDAFASVVRLLSGGFDHANGGFGSAPKFPEPSLLNFLFADSARTGDAAAAELALAQLRAMDGGGIHDQLGGGFHRYSTDARWFLPHFEKMLYDQAQLAGSYLDAYQFTRDPQYATAARSILDDVLREMTGPDGQFYSALDADSAVSAATPDERAEGRFYVWRADEIEAALGARSAAIFDAHFGVKPDGNVADDPRHKFDGRNVLYVAQSIAQTAAQFNEPVDAIQKTIDDAKRTLLAIRDQRPHPRLDDKAIVAWNGLMISAFARGGVVLDEPRYADAATRAATFIRTHLYNATAHTLQRRWRDGQAAVPAFLSDYAFYISGLIDLYEASGRIEWLQLALDLQQTQDAKFADAANGGYFSTASDEHDAALPRDRGPTDNAEPSGNSIAAMNLLRLAGYSDDGAARSRGERTLAAFASEMRREPTAWPQMLCAAELAANDRRRQIVLAGDVESPDLIALRREAFARFLPGKTVLYADGGAGQTFLATRLDFLAGVKPTNGHAAAFVCTGRTCGAPTTQPAALAKSLANRDR